jgi:hypothetical protein
MPGAVGVDVLNGLRSNQVLHPYETGIRPDRSRLGLIHPRCRTADKPVLTNNGSLRVVSAATPAHDETHGRHDHEAEHDRSHDGSDDAAARSRSTATTRPMSPFTRRVWSTLKLLQADTSRKLARTRFSVNPQDQTRCTVIGRSTAIRGMSGRAGRPDLYSRSRPWR